MENRSRKKISRVSVVDQVCDALKADIEDGVWKMGDKLPSESELASYFGVNRLSVRMALQKLNTLGIVETLVGDGTYVKKFSLRTFLQEVAFVYDNEARYRDSQQLRRLMEGECLHIAIKQATEEDKADLYRLLQEYNARLAEYAADIDNIDNLNALVDADFAFHYRIVKMSGNSAYKDVYYMVQQLIREHILSLVSVRVKNMVEHGIQVPLTNDGHAKIYQCIAEGNAEDADLEMDKMLKITLVDGMDFDEY